MALWLLERGADLNVRPVIDITPLSHAVKYATPDLLRELLDRGGDVQKGEVLQHALNRSTDVVTVLGMLLDKGAPLNAVMYANHPGSWRMYFFLERGTPLHKAATIGNAEAVRFLLDRGADPSIPNSKGRKALECAERAGHKEIVEMLANERVGHSKRLPTKRRSVAR
jgi:ankyrin repeat protein